MGGRATPTSLPVGVTSASVELTFLLVRELAQDSRAGWRLGRPGSSGLNMDLSSFDVSLPWNLDMDLCVCPSSQVKKPSVLRPVDWDPR